MADYKPIYDATIRREGGFKLIDVKGDRGGQTYAGIARVYHSDWGGWALIDAKKTVPEDLVYAFYKENFWDAVCGDKINNQKIAETIYDFGVNAGTRVARKLAQKALGIEADGIFGPNSLASLNAANTELFVAKYALQKVGHYRNIIDAAPDQVKFIKGWLNRALEGLV